jgi:SAM-dependent methyltransferase
MSTDYNTIAREYQQAKQHPWRQHIEAFTLVGLIGDPAGLAVLDLACGEGFYTRFLKRSGAVVVVGVDLSAGMIDLARQEETERPLGIEYRVGDARQVDMPGCFDLVTAGYLLNYASSREELLQMCQAIAHCLKPGGRFVTVNNNPAQPPESFAATRKYGLVKELPEGTGEGAPVVFRLFLEGHGDLSRRGDLSRASQIEITNYLLSPATHEWAFRTAGFREVVWHRPRLSPAGEKEYEPGYWDMFLEHPPVTFIECRK